MGAKDTECGLDFRLAERAELHVFSLANRDNRKGLEMGGGVIAVSRKCFCLFV